MNAINNVWEIITAISTAATAAVAIATYLVVKRQAAIQLPTVTLSSGADTNNDYGSITLQIDPPESAKYGIERVVATYPPTARLAEWVSDPLNKRVPGTWSTELTREPVVCQTGFCFTAPRSTRVSIHVHVSLRSDRRTKHVISLTARMHD